MIAHLQAIQTALEDEGWSCFLGDASGATSWPYIVVTLGYMGGPERPLADATATVDADVRVLVAGASAASVAGLSSAVRDVLSPSLTWGALTVTGRVAHTRWVRSEMTAVDRDVTLPGTGTHPIFTVDTYRLASEPDPNYVAPAPEPES